VQLERLIVSGFQSFGPEPTTLNLSSRTFLLGANGSGKTAVLQALARLFGYSPEIRRVRESDFHRPISPAEVTDGVDPSLTLEAHFSYDELEDDEEVYPSVAPGFWHMSLVDLDGVPELRVRLTATIDDEGEIDEQIRYITGLDDEGEPTSFAKMSRSDRSLFQVHYLPARRDPVDHVRHTATSLIGRVLRAASWGSELGDIKTLSDELSGVLAGHAGVKGLDSQLAEQWGAVHSGGFFADPEIAFNVADLDGLLRHLTIDFKPSHSGARASFDQLSDGQQSLLYISLVLAVQSLGRKALAGELPAFDLLKLRPPVFVMIAVEEPENSLSPHHLGRILAQLTSFSENEDAQVVLATHSPALLRRVPPSQVRHLRLDESRRTCIATIAMPKRDADAAKFVREAVQAYPELYFARLVVLGEGDSEEIVLPRLFAAHDLLPDHVSISVVPLGGRHVNHFWRLLEALAIPYVTLLDLDAGRFGGGWGRIKYAMTQYGLLRGSLDEEGKELLAELPRWDCENRPDGDDVGKRALAWLEGVGVFFSSPLDLDYTMMQAYPTAYEVEDDEIGDPDDTTISAVLGKKHGAVDCLYDEDERSLFDAYRARFKAGSKPAEHLAGLGRLRNKTLLAKLPSVYGSLVAAINDRLAALPE
jgi:putative ATP-dependent endonuclease of OLD family